MKVRIANGSAMITSWMIASFVLIVHRCGEVRYAAEV
jgi:hypothetical protein